MFTTFAPAALMAWTAALWKPYRRSIYFGSLIFWVIVAFVLMIKVVIFGAGVAVILVAQVVAWVLDLVTLGRFRYLAAKLADLSTSGSFDEAREQSIQRWSKN